MTQQADFMDRAEAEQKPMTAVQTDGEEFIHLITHDLRGCLRALHSLPEWIREDLEDCAADVPPDVFRHLQMLETHANRADRMLLDLREFATVGTSLPATDPVSLKGALNTAIQSTDLPPEFRVTEPDQDAMLCVPADELDQVLTAILSNCIKHHDRETGQITLSVNQAEGVIELCDDGPGIAPEYREKVFEVLSTLRPRDECEGSGVGLALARKIVTTWGGQIVIAEPEQSKGTRVKITVPAAFMRPDQPGLHALQA